MLVIVAVAVLLLISRNSISAGLVDALETPITLVVVMANVVNPIILGAVMVASAAAENVPVLCVAKS